MAKKTKPKIPVSNEPRYCGTCEKCYDPHSPDIKGNPILGRCPFKEFSVFLRHDTCDKYKAKL